VAAAGTGLLAARSGTHSVFFTELIDTTAGIDDLLFAGIKRVARRAHLYKKVVAKRGAR